ncbi:ABC transporter ATP-binding protein [Caldibacillus thermoamylovorans]|nr:ABC transporter ATP-binding protein [Caldibacillus thermoamylovorans]
MNEIKVENISFSYTDGQPVLSNIDVHFRQESTAIIGQNGAGKTTFVKLIKGLLKPVVGNIYVNGMNTQEYTVAQLASQIGLVFQNPNDQIFKHTVIEEVMFGPKNIGQSTEEARQNGLLALEKMGIVHEADKNPYDLSLSDRKLVSIASILAMKPPIIIFDEPTMGQDYLGKERLKKIMKDLRAEGVLVLSIIHDMDFVAETFERTIVMNQGKIVLDGPTREVFSHEQLIRDVYLELPHATQLGKQLGLKQTFLTVDELINFNRKKQ